MSKQIDNINHLIKVNSILDVNTERLETYLDFIITLVMYVFETYPGDDVMLNNEENIINHFKYCWKRTVSDFENEGLTFKTDDNLFDLFYADFTQRFYYNEQRTEANEMVIKNNIIRTHSLILNPFRKRTVESYSNFITLYYLFEKNAGVKC